MKLAYLMSPVLYNFLISHNLSYIVTHTPALFFSSHEAFNRGVKYGEMNFLDVTLFPL